MYTLTTDAYLTGIGATLTQKQQDIDRVIAYASKTLNKGQKNYSTIKRKLETISNRIFQALFPELYVGTKILNSYV